MIEKVILDHLNKYLTVAAYMEEPEQPTTSYVILERVGSSRENMIETASFAVQSYGKDLLEAATLNDTVKEIMYNLVECKEVASCKLQTDYNFTDPATMRYRYQALFDVVHY